MATLILALVTENADRRAAYWIAPDTRRLGATAFGLLCLYAVGL